MGYTRVSLSSLPLDYKQILMFLSYLQIKGLSPTTITTYLSAIGYVHKSYSVNDPTSKFIVQKVLASVNKLHGSSDSRLPITLVILHQLLDSVYKAISNSYNAKLLRAMFAIAFYGLFRVGEITVQKSGIVPLYLDQLKVFHSYFQINITHFKNNKTNRPFEILIHKNGGDILPLCYLNGLSVSKRMW